MLRVIIILLVLFSTSAFTYCSAIEHRVTKKNEQNTKPLRSKDIIKYNKLINKETKKLEIKQEEIEHLEKRIQQKQEKLEKLNNKYVKGENK